MREHVRGTEFPIVSQSMQFFKDENAYFPELK